MTDELNDFLAHYGVLGMHWGVRHDPEKGGGTGRKAAKSIPLTDHEKAVQKALGGNEHTSEVMKARYGPGTNKKDKKGLTPKQKKILIGVSAGILAAGVIGTGIYLHKSGKLPVSKIPGLNAIFKKKVPTEAVKDVLDPEFDAHYEKVFEKLMGQGAKAEAKAAAKLAKENAKLPEAMASFMKDHTDVSSTRFMKGWSKEEVDKLSSEPFLAKAGAIFKRVSTEAESEINEDGFYAAYKPEDVERYKAVLPTYWKQWGLPAKEGFVVHLKASEDIKAPSPKDTFNIFKDWLLEEGEGLDPITFEPTKILNKDLFQVNVPVIDHDDFARKIFPAAALGWNNTMSPPTFGFMEKVKSMGYNALFDMNDIGSIGEAPMRLLDGDLFTIDKHEPLSAAAIKAAQDAVLALKHFFQQLGISFTNIFTERWAS